MSGHGRWFSRSEDKAEIEDGQGRHPICLTETNKAGRQTGLDEADDGEARLRHGDEAEETVGGGHHAIGPVGGLKRLDGEAAGNVAGLEQGDGQRIAQPGAVVGGCSPDEALAP